MGVKSVAFVFFIVGKHIVIHYHDYDHYQYGNRNTVTALPMWEK